MDSSIADLRRVWSVNLEAPIELMSLALNQMKEQAFGRVVNVTSVHARFSRKDCLAYDVAKAGLEAATRSAALTGADFGVLVNAVAPGFVRTQMSVNEEGIDEADTDEFHRDFVAHGRLPQMRAAQPGEIAKAVAWLASRDNTYTTGQTITIDGGLTITF
jgi:3-oxoacyl-[acyl-carrier protein] reductase